MSLNKKDYEVKTLINDGAQSVVYPQIRISVLIKDKQKQVVTSELVLKAHLGEVSLPDGFKESIFSNMGFLGWPPGRHSGVGISTLKNYLIKPICIGWGGRWVATHKW